MRKLSLSEGTLLAQVPPVVRTKLGPIPASAVTFFLPVLDVVSATERDQPSDLVPDRGTPTQMWRAQLSLGEATVPPRPWKQPGEHVDSQLLFITVLGSLEVN